MSNVWAKFAQHLFKSPALMECVGPFAVPGVVQELFKSCSYIVLDLLKASSRLLCEEPLRRELRNLCAGLWCVWRNERRLAHRDHCERRLAQYRDCLSRRASRAGCCRSAFICSPQPSAGRFCRHTLRSSTVWGQRTHGESPALVAHVVVRLSLVVDPPGAQRLQAVPYTAKTSMYANAPFA